MYISDEQDTPGPGLRHRLDDDEAFGIPAHDNTGPFLGNSPVPSSPSTTTGEESYATAVDTLPPTAPRRHSAIETGRGLWISEDYTNNHSTSSLRRRQRMRISAPSITAAAAAQLQWRADDDDGNNNLRQAEQSIESSRELANLDAELRRRSLRLAPRRDNVGRWAQMDELEALRELAAFLRSVTPPPTNLMSVPDPKSPSTTLSSVPSSVRRRGSRKTRRNPISRALGGLFRSGSSRRKRKPVLVRKRPGSPTSSVHQQQHNQDQPQHQQQKKKKKRRAAPPPRIKLPDTAVAGRTVDGFRHIAISIPIEHAHLGPEPRYKFPSGRGRSRSSPPLDRSVASESAAVVYSDVNVRPLSAFVASTEPHVGTQLGPLVEERESLSSRSFEKGSSSTGSAANEYGMMGAAAAAARKVRLASRNTFGTVHEEGSSRPGTAGKPLMSPPLPLRVSSDEGSSSPHSIRSSEEIRAAAQRQAFVALSGGVVSVPGPSNTRPASSSGPNIPAAGGPARPGSAYSSLRSFPLTGSPANRVYPMRKSSLSTRGRGRSNSATTHQQQQSGPHSRTSSMDHTMQESIFSEPAYLESMDTMDSVGEQLQQQLKEAAVIREARPARRFGGSEVVVFDAGTPSSRRSLEARREKGESSDTSGSGKRSRPQRHSDPGPAVARRGEQRSGGGRSMLPTVVVVAEESEPTSPVITQKTSQKSVGGDGTAEMQSTTAGISERLSRFVEDLDEAAQPSQPETAAGSETRATMREISETDAGSAAKVNSALSGRNIIMPAQEVGSAAPVEEQDKIPITSQPAVSAEAEDKAPQPTLQTSPVIAPAITVSRPQDKGKGKQIEAPGTPPRLERRLSAGKSIRVDTKKEDQGSPPASPGLPSPKERREQRRSTLISRKERIAALRKKLDKPGSQPQDLVWRRLSTSSSEGSGDKTPTRSTGAVVPSPTRPKTLPASLSFTRVHTVADVRPTSLYSSPSPGLARKDSVPLSVSSPTTVATVIKTSPIPPYRSLGSVTPPDSPPASGTSASSSRIALDDTTQATPLRHPPVVPLKRLNYNPRRGSGRTSPASSTRSGPRSPLAAAQEQTHSPQRPKTAGKGTMGSKKDFFGQRAVTPQALDQGQSSSGQPAMNLRGKSVLNMSRSEIFDRYDALREKQAHDMERRLRKLERNGEYWLTSMLPLLTDLSSTLGQLALGNGSADQQQQPRQRGGFIRRKASKSKSKGKGKEVQERATTSHGDGRQSRFAMRRPSVANDEQEEVMMERPQTSTSALSDDSLDNDESIVFHHRRRQGPRGGTESRRSRTRLYLYDDIPTSPAPQDPAPREDSPRSFPLSSPESHRPPRRPRNQPPQTSGSTTMVDSAATAAAVAATQRLARAEKISERVMRRLALLDHDDDDDHAAAALGASPPKVFGSRNREAARSHEAVMAQFLQRRRRGSLATYEGSEWDDGVDDGYYEDEEWVRATGTRGVYYGGAGRVTEAGLERLEPIMRELQASGTRLSMESEGTDLVGDQEVRRMRAGPGPRAVVGFGAFTF